MKPFMQFGLCCLLAPGLFATHPGGGAVGGGHGGGGTPGHNAGHVHSPVRTFGYGLMEAMATAASMVTTSRSTITGIPRLRMEAGPM